jgi:hypothetical protein
MTVQERSTAATYKRQPVPGRQLSLRLWWRTGENAYGQGAKQHLEVVAAVGNTSLVAGQAETNLEMVADPGNSSLPHDIKQDKKIEDFLQSVYLLADVGDTRRAIDEIFDYFNGLLRSAGKLNVCNGTLAAVDLESINPTLMVAFLSITLPVKGDLWARPGFFAAVRRKLIEERGEDRASRLLDKYE